MFREEKSAVPVPLMRWEHDTESRPAWQQGYHEGSSRRYESAADEFVTRDLRMVRAHSPSMPVM